MTLARAIERSPLHAATRPARRSGGTVVAMKIKGAIRIVESLSNPAIKRAVPRPFDLASKDWRPVKERVA